MKALVMLVTLLVAISLSSSFVYLLLEAADNLKGMTT